MDLSVEAEAFGSAIRFDEKEVPAVMNAIVQSEDAANALMELYYTEEAMTAFDAQDGIGMNGDGA